MASRPVAVVFDLYGTLLNLNAVVETCSSALAKPEQWKAVANAWREKQLSYTWLQNSMGVHEPFDAVTRKALDYVMDALPDVFGDNREAARKQLLAAYRKGAAFADAEPVLQRLADAGIRCAVLSNGTPDGIASAIEGTGLSRFFHKSPAAAPAAATASSTLLSVEQVQPKPVYKPDPSVYQLAVATLGAARPGDIVFVSSNCWDACGAAAVGFRVCWCNRAGAPRDPLPHSGDIAYEGRDLHAVLQLLGLSSTA